ncbi:MAG TPA: PLP-dependent aspartate aminotransferase family protein [Gaiellales bacterium]|nr:PLP-dependent aspartate aminotransferase family protein [Gaiellales bacterium]
MTHRETRLVQASREPGAGLAPSLERAVTFHNMPLAEGGSPYGRSQAPVAAEAEALLGDLEQATALLFASGMTAWTALCLAVARPGRPVAIPTIGYYGYETHAQTVLEPFGIEVRRYAATDLDALGEAADGASVTLTESPLNPTLDVIDIAAAAGAAHAGGGLLVCDNTASSPMLQLPLDMGADVTLQSGTKYLAGHSDTLAGVLAMRDAELAERIRHVRSETGMVLGPDPSWLLLRGLRTLAVRVQRQSATALEIAGRLESHPAVTAVCYPGLASHPGHELAARQMRGGFGCLIAFQLATAEGAEAVERHLQVIHPATSLGSVESLIERRDRIEPPGRIAPGLLRLSIGLEHPDDLWADLEQALAAAVS